MTRYDENMDVYQVIKTRRSVRSYKPDPVPEEVLNRILEAARLAPSAHNGQDYKFVVVKDSQKRKLLAQAAEQDFISQAPIIIAAVSLDPDKIISCGAPTYAVDLAIAVDHLTLAAAAEGLGICWIGAFNQKEAKKILGVPAQSKIVILLPLGFPADQPGTKVRKNLAEIACFERFEE